MWGPSKILALTGALLGLVIFATPATALETGVYITPGAPAAKQYSFPLSVLRAAAGGHGTIPGAVVPRFGVGITPPSRASAGASGPASGSSRVAGQPQGRRPGSPHHRSHKTAANAELSRRARPTTLQASEIASLVRPRSSASQVALIGVPALLGGLALGGIILAVRRRSAE